MAIPHAKISNSLIQAQLYLPDPEKGYYRGNRFDWSGNIPVLSYKGHNFFGKWFDKYSPEIHDVIMGPAEEFTALDYLTTRPGETFMKIGVGILIKPDDQPYAFSRLYPVANRGKWTVKTYPEKVDFTHILKDKFHSYQYEKRVELINDKPELVLFHTLKNTGIQTIETTVYDHNFFVMDDQPVGPDFIIKFPFNLSGGGEGIGELAELRGKNIEFLRIVKSGETVFCCELKGFGPDSKDYDFRIENRKIRAGARVRCDKPLLKLNYWNCSTTLCPEPYIKVIIDPGRQMSWTMRYEFYTL